MTKAKAAARRSTSAEHGTSAFVQTTMFPGEEDAESFSETLNV
jgi:hypothetical protein